MAEFFPYPALYNGIGEGAADIQDKFATTESPKLKFNHYVRFKFRSSSPGGESLGGLSYRTNFLALRQTGRITPVIHYEDTNYYGYRTKVAVRTDYSAFNMTLYDDSANRAHSIIDAYMEAVSPLANAPSAVGTQGLQTITALENGSQLGIIEKIEVLHTSINQNTKYTLFNPKITNILLDELDMTASDVTSITMSFVFDGYRVDKTRNDPSSDDPNDDSD